MSEFEVVFEKIVPEGKALGKRDDGKVVFCFGVLPGEKARVRTLYEKKGYVMAELMEVLEPSPLRVPPQEEHFLSCSPWQIIPYEKQVEFKADILREVYYQVLKEEIEVKEFSPSPAIFGYRTKMEFSFVATDKGISLAFHKRGSWFKKIPVKGCVLASEKMNKAVSSLVDFLNKKEIGIAHLKTVVVRESKAEDERLIILYVPEERLDTRYFAIEALKETDGFLIVYSHPQSPASVVSQVLKIERKDYLIERVLGKELKYYFDSFFQNNIPTFEKALEKMREWAGEPEKVLELYGGVGTISICLGVGREITMVEIDEKMVELSQENAFHNNISNFKALALPDRKLPSDLFQNVDLLILDPPRAGLHKRVIKAILKHPPQRILYLSCNPITQARDYSFLRERYKPLALYGFDFYPNTPHLESLLILEKRS